MGVKDNDKNNDQYPDHRDIVFLQPPLDRDLVIINHASLSIDVHLLEWKGFVKKSVTGTRTLKTSIMWSSNQLSLILHSSAVRSCQRFLRGFFFWMIAARLLRTFYSTISF